MNTLRHGRSAALAVLVGLATALAACSDPQSSLFTAPVVELQGHGTSPDDIDVAIAAQNRHTPALLRIPGVVGTAVGRLADGRAAVRIFISSMRATGLPANLDGVPAHIEFTGPFMALSNPTTRARPAPMGYSLGHPDITAGSIGARVVNGIGSVYVLSNNHVLANSNDASLGDPALQPGPYDGGSLADQIGTLSAFRPINFSGGSNTMDAAIALTSALNVGNSTPLDDGYGTPGATVYGDANGDGLFDNKNALLNLPVQKYGRTTKLTHGTITGINATVTVCYEQVIFCVKAATFVDQLIITPGGFSGGGDSGSLIVSDNAGRNPVGLLFAGSSAQTIANRIDLVLNYFGVTIDAGGPPPAPVTDAAIGGVAAPGSVTQGNSANVVVTVQNSGNQTVGSSFNVTLVDQTDNVSLGTQSVAGLAIGASTNLSFSWNTAGSSLGSHTLVATHDLADGNAGNNQGSTTSTVTAPGSSVTIHVGDLDGITSDDGTTWSAIVEITVHDANHAPINGATIVGDWSRNGLASDTCTTGDLGGNGTCIMLFPGLGKKSAKSVSFTVLSVTMAGQTYQATSNHDVDGSSNGTTIKVNRP